MMQLSKAYTYENKKSEKQVKIIRIQKAYVQVEYLVTGSKAWYMKGDFNKLFKLL